MSSAQSPNNKEWTSLLDFFAEKGICADHKRNALLAAADMSNRESDELAWPDSLRKVSNMMGPAGFDRLAFRIHHLKVTDRPGVPLEAKAYLVGVTNSAIPTNSDHRLIKQIRQYCNGTCRSLQNRSSAFAISQGLSLTHRALLGKQWLSNKCPSD